MGEELRTGRTLLLSGELGCGKTCFVQGLAQGLDVSARYVISSPSYTLINQYPGRLPLVHVDLYRLNSQEEAEAVGLGDMLNPSAVIAVEWAEKIDRGYWPADALWIRFRTLPDDGRRLTIEHGLDSDILLNNLIAKWSQSADR